MEINDLSPDVVVCSGDLTTFGYKQEYRQAREYLERLDLPRRHHDPREPRLAQRRPRPLREPDRAAVDRAAQGRDHLRRRRLVRARPRPRRRRPQPLLLDRGAVLAAGRLPRLHPAPPPAADPRHRARAKRRPRRRATPSRCSSGRVSTSCSRATSTCRTPGGSRICSSSTRAPSRRCACAATRGPATTSSRSPPTEVAVYRKYPFHGRETIIRFSPVTLAYEKHTRPDGDLMRPALVLVDGEHYPAVVRAAIEQASRDGPRGRGPAPGRHREAATGSPTTACRSSTWTAMPAAAMVAAARRHGAERVVDLSDEPVLDERGALPADRARARGRPRVLGRRLRVPARRRGTDAGVPALAVVGTASGSGRPPSAATRPACSRPTAGVVVVAMGRGGPAAARGGRRRRLRGSGSPICSPARGPGPRRLRLPRGCGARRASSRSARAGAASGLAGAPFLSNVVEAVAAARAARARPASCSKDRVRPFRRWRPTARCW